MTPSRVNSKSKNTSVTTIGDDEFETILEAICDHLSHAEHNLTTALKIFDSQVVSSSSSSFSSIPSHSDRTPPNLIKKRQPKPLRNIKRASAPVTREHVLSLPIKTIEDALSQMASARTSANIGSMLTERKSQQGYPLKEAFLRRIRAKQIPARNASTLSKNKLQLEVPLPTDEEAEEILAREEDILHDTREAYAAALRAKVAAQRRERQHREADAARKKKFENGSNHTKEHNLSNHTQFEESPRAKHVKTIPHAQRPKLNCDIKREYQENLTEFSSFGLSSESNHASGRVEHSTTSLSDIRFENSPLNKQDSQTVITKGADDTTIGTSACADSKNKHKSIHISLSKQHKDLHSNETTSNSCDLVDSWALTGLDAEAKVRISGRQRCTNIFTKKSPCAASGSAQQQQMARCSINQRRPEMSEYKCLADWQKRPELKIMRSIFGCDTETQERESFERARRQKELERMMARKAEKRRELKNRILAMAEEAIHHLDERDRLSESLIEMELETGKQLDKPKHAHGSYRRRQSEPVALSSKHSMLFPASLARRNTYNSNTDSPPAPVSVGRWSFSHKKKETSDPSLKKNCSDLLNYRSNEESSSLKLISANNSCPLRHPSTDKSLACKSIAHRFHKDEAPISNSINNFGSDLIDQPNTSTKEEEDDLIYSIYPTLRSCSASSPI
eukprot:gene9365-1622_t